MPGGELAVLSVLVQIRHDCGASNKAPQGPGQSPWPPVNLKMLPRPEPCQKSHGTPRGRYSTPPNHFPARTGPHRPKGTADGSINGDAAQEAHPAVGKQQVRPTA